MSHMTSWEPGPFRGPTNGVSSIFLCVSSTVLNEDLPEEGYNQPGAGCNLHVCVQPFKLSDESFLCSPADGALWYHQMSAFQVLSQRFCCCAPPSGPREPEKGPAWNRMMHGWWEGPRRPGLVPSTLRQAWCWDPERLSHQVVRFQHYAVVLERQIEKILPFQPSSLSPFRALRPNRLSVHTPCQANPNPPLPAPRAQGDNRAKCITTGSQTCKRASHFVF